MCLLTHFNNINDILQWGRSNHDKWVGIFPTFQQSWQCAAIQEPGRNRKWELTVTTFNSFWKYLFSALFFSLFIFDLSLETQTVLAFISDNKLLFTKMNIYLRLCHCIVRTNVRINDLESYTTAKCPILCSIYCNLFLVINFPFFWL